MGNDEKTFSSFLPTQFSILISQICLFWWIVDSSLWGYRKACKCSEFFSLKGSPTGFRSDVWLSDSLVRQMVESRMLYVWTEERMLLYEMFLLYMKKLCATSIPLCSPRSTPTWPFDVKPPTYEPIGLIPTRELQDNSRRQWALLIIDSSMFEYGKAEGC